MDDRLDNLSTYTKDEHGTLHHRKSAGEDPYLSAHSCSIAPPPSLPSTSSATTLRPELKLNQIGKGNLDGVGGRASQRARRGADGPDGRVRSEERAG